MKLREIYRKRLRNMSDRKLMQEETILSKKKETLEFKKEALRLEFCKRTEERNVKL